jgi:fumarate hydratase class II
LTWACEATGSSIEGFSVNRERIEQSLAANPILVTALNTRIGYEAAAVIAKRSYSEKRPVIDVAEEETGLSRSELQALLDPLQLTNAQPPDDD